MALWEPARASGVLETVQGSMQAEGFCLQIGLLPGAISHFFSPPPHSRNSGPTGGLQV